MVSSIHSRNSASLAPVLHLLPMEPGVPYTSTKILHKLHLNLYIHCCFHLQRRFIWSWLIATILFGSICCQLWIAEPPFVNKQKYWFAFYTLHSILYFNYLCFYFNYLCCFWFLCPPYKLALLYTTSNGCGQFFCIILGFFVYHSFIRHCGVAVNDAVPHGTAFIIVSALLMKIPSVGNEGADRNMVWSGRNFFCLPMDNLQQCFMKCASVRSCIAKVLQWGVSVC